MYLLSLMKFHYCLFKVLRKNQNVADRQTDGKTDGKTKKERLDGQHETVYLPTPTPHTHFGRPGRLAQLRASLTANQGVVGSSPRPATYFRGDLS